MNVYRELVGPSVVTHCEEVRFFNTENTNLAVIKGNTLLQLFRTESVQSASNDNENAKDIEDADLNSHDSFISSEVTAIEMTRNKQNANITQDKLFLVGEWPLQGHATALKRVRISGIESDCLMITFKYAKAVIMAWDPINLNLQPLSIHYYEEHMINDPHASHFVDPNFQVQCAVDPDSNCMCLLYQKDSFALLPFVQADEIDDADASAENKPRPIFTGTSFLSASQIEKSVSNVIHIDFLFEYREPTLALLFEPQRTWVGTQSLYKDTVKYLVLSLDLDQRSSTTIISADGLPYDLFKIVPLPAPTGGALLLGFNHILYIDSSGRVTGISVNKYSKQITSLPLKDKSHLNLYLEGSCVSVIDPKSGSLMLVTAKGDLFSLTLNIEGRRVLGLELGPISFMGPAFKLPRPSCAAKLGINHVFIGSKTDDSKLIRWTATNGEEPQHTPVKEPKKAKKAEDEEDEDDLYGDDEDDLDAYADSQPTSGQVALKYSVCDFIPTYGPLNSICVGSYRGTPALVATSGAQETGGLCIFQERFRMKKVKEFRIDSLGPKLFSIGFKSSADNYVVVTKNKSTSLLQISSEGHTIKDISQTMKIVRKQKTIGAYSIKGHDAFVQVFEHGLALHDSNFHRLQVVKMETIDIISSSCINDFVMVVLSDGQFHLYQVANKQLNRVASPPNFPERVQQASLTETSLVASGPAVRQNKRKKHESDETRPTSSLKRAAAVCLTGSRVIIWELQSGFTIHLSDASSMQSILHMQDTLPPEALHAADMDIKAAQIISLGEGEEVLGLEEHLVLVTIAEICIYRLAQASGRTIFKKVTAWPIRQKSKNADQIITVEPIRLGSLHAALISGTGSTRGQLNVIVKGAQTSPVIRPIFESSIVPFNMDGLVENGALVRSSGSLVVLTEDRNINYTAPWQVRKVLLGETVHQVSFHASSGLYVVTTSREIPYNAVDEDGELIPNTNPDENPKAISFKGSLKLISPLTWAVIDEIEYEDNEVALSSKTVCLEVSEKSKLQKEFIAVGTTTIRGEDLPTKGTFYIYDAVGIVPEPGKPEKDHKLKEVSHEVVKGQVSTLCEVAGNLLIAQGQKVVVRNMQEDNSIIPVAFLDFDLYITEAKSIKNLVMLGDALRSIWLVGFGNEPYRMTTVSKDLRDVRVLSGDFLVTHGKLFPIVSDGDGYLQIMEYDPEDTTSLVGQRLLLRSKFFTGRQFNSMVSIPMRVFESPSTSHMTPLAVSSDGTISSVIPISEPAYRIMYVVQQQIIDKDGHNACLNPRMHRNLDLDISSHTSAAAESRVVIDWEIVSRYSALSQEKQAQFSRKLGKSGSQDIQYVLSSINEMPEWF